MKASSFKRSWWRRSKINSGADFEREAIEKKKKKEEMAGNEADEDTAPTVIGRGVLTSGGRAARVASCPFVARERRALWEPVAA